jgi:hypothetical protein
MAKKMTANAGASIERGKLLAKLRRMRVIEGGFDSTARAYNEALEDIAAWVKESAARASKRPGGLGRKQEQQAQGCRYR